MTAPLSPERLSEIRAREQSALPGEWRVSVPQAWVTGFENGRLIWGNCASDGSEREIGEWFADVSDMEHANAEFIAHARQDIPALLDEVERLTRELAAADAALDLIAPIESRKDAEIRAAHKTLDLHTDTEAGPLTLSQRIEWEMNRRHDLIIAARESATAKAEAIAAACGIIERADARLLAADGDCGGQPPDMTLTEWVELYATLDAAREVQP